MNVVKIKVDKLYKGGLRCLQILKPVSKQGIESERHRTESFSGNAEFFVPGILKGMLGVLGNISNTKNSLLAFAVSTLPALI